MVVLAGVGGGLLIAALGPNTWRAGAIVIGASLTVGAIERLVLPPRSAGLLSVRSRPFDVALLTLVGVAIIALALVVPPAR